jgi:peptidoglycan/LPS O-acetylase OafA/YrhL
MPSSLSAQTALAVALLHYLLAIGSFGVWVARDAAARGNRRATLWGVGTAVTAGLVGAYYLFVRARLDDRTHPPTRDERAARAVALAAVSAWVLASVFSPPDPSTQVFYGVGLLAVTLPLGYLLDYRGGYDRLRGREG